MKTPVILFSLLVMLSGCRNYSDTGRGDFEKSDVPGRPASVNAGSGSTGTDQERISGDGTRPRGTSTVNPNPTFENVPNTVTLKDSNRTKR
jgi:hypothetical protein